MAPVSLVGWTPLGRGPYPSNDHVQEDLGLPRKAMALERQTERGTDKQAATFPDANQFLTFPFSFGCVLSKCQLHLLCGAQGTCRPLDVISRLRQL